MTDHETKRRCPTCKRLVTVLKDGTLATHGPGPRGAFLCPGGGDKAMVRAARHITTESLAPEEHP